MRTKNSVQDPRQKLALSYYTDPNSETFADKKNSLIKAGYSPKTANALSLERHKWINGSAESTVQMVQKAESNLKKYLELTKGIDIKASKLNVDVARLEADVSKFVAERLASGKYSKDKEDKQNDISINVIMPEAPDKVRDVKSEGETE